MKHSQFIKRLAVMSLLMAARPPPQVSTRRVQKTNPLGHEVTRPPATQRVRCLNPSGQHPPQILPYVNLNKINGAT